MTHGKDGAHDTVHEHEVPANPPISVVVANTGVGEPATTVEVFSVAELVALREDEATDPWRLSLVQRALVWQERQVAYLLDSLLFGYPIGSLLLCTVLRDGNVFEMKDGLRLRRSAPEGTWQLLDGQQRLNALAWIFAGPTAPEQGRFLVRLDAQRDIEDVTLRKRNQEQALRYITAASPGEEVVERSRWFDASLVYQASRANLIPDAQEAAAAPVHKLLEWAERIDPLCAHEGWQAAGVAAIGAAAERFRRLLHAWHVRAVPVVKLRLESPVDVLQVFARVNRTGTAVAGEDVFFAGVKTLWADAEEHVERVRRSSPLLHRIAALRVLARVANQSLHGVDMLPLDVERLGGKPGRDLTSRMAELASPTSQLVTRIAEVSRAAIETSGLGAGLKMIHPALFDHVFAWAFARDPWPPASEEWSATWAYLFGATAFGYREVFTETFDRLAFQRAVAAGRGGHTFPLEEIAADCRVKWPELRKTRRQIGGVATDADKRSFVNDAWQLALYVVQQVPYPLPAGRKLDWEHLYPQARMNEMRWKGSSGSSRLQRYPGADRVWHTGNLFALDEKLNRSAQDDWPDEKLRYYGKNGVSLVDLFLSESECVDLLAACELVKKRDVVAGVPRFVAYVEAREQRIFDELYRRFPRAFVLAREH
jgi:hypothetical protein